MNALLEVSGLVVRYGGIEAVKGVDLTIHKGELVTLIGANGAGKTSTLKALAGLLKPAQGEVRFQGELLSATPIHQLIQKGLALVPEGRGVFPRLTVAENLSMGAYSRKDQAGIRSDLDQVFDSFPRLQERRHQKAGTLSGGEQQMLAIGRALMGRPTLLLLDEPSMGLAPLMVQNIFSVIKRVAQEGMTVFLVEQNARLALQAAQRAYVMEGGVIRFQASAQECLNDPRVRSAYLGEDA
jgi:branched-chain amino acid transport system ATP-binding protein